MWGNAHEATDLEPTHPLGNLLFQLSHPKPIDYDDESFWSQFFQQYGLLVHLDPQAWSSSSNSNPVVSTACSAMCRNASKSHNLAALTLHGARMVRELHVAYLEHKEQQRSSYSTTTNGHNHGGDENDNGTAASSSSILASFTGGGGSSKKGQPDQAACTKKKEANKMETSLIGKARVTCGVLNVLRIFCHSVIISACQPPPPSQDESTATEETAQSSSHSHEYGHGLSSSSSSSKILNDIFCYPDQSSKRSSSTRQQPQQPQTTNAQPATTTRDSAMELIQALVLFLSIRDVPSALYDTIVMALSLMLVLMSTQLYQPMISSLEQMESTLLQTQQQQQQQQDQVDSDHTSSFVINNNNGMGNHYFLDKLLYGAHDCRLKLYEQQQQQNMSYQEGTNSSSTSYGKDSPSTTTLFDWSQTLLISLLHWTTSQPYPPDGKAYRSISYHHTELVRAIVQSKSGLKPDPHDGLYWGHPSIVVSSKRPARLMQEQQKQHGSMERTLSHSSSSSGGVGTISSSTSTLVATTRQRLIGGNIVQAATLGVMMASSTILLFPFRLVKLAFHVFGSLAFARGGGHNSLSAPTEDELNCLHSLAHDHGSGSSRRPVTNDVIWISDSPIADMAGCLLLLLTHNFRAKDTSTTNTSSWDNDNTSNNEEQQGRSLESSYYQQPQQLEGDEMHHHHHQIDHPDDQGGKIDGNDHSNRGIYPNEFLLTLSTLQDNRWEGNHSTTTNSSMVVTLIGGNGENDFSANASMDTGVLNTSQRTGGWLDSSVAAAAAAAASPFPPLSMNFERLFVTFGDIVHTELGALLLYTLLQTSPKFAASISARSDLDTLVMPLLKTLYFSLSMPMSEETTSVTSSLGLSSSKANSNSSHRSRNSNVSSNNNNNGTFRSPSQLYVILILLLLFSQDSSFGSDAFRRINIPAIAWYRERTLKDISLGSVLVLVLLRSLTFNLNRLQDAFLLTNCCAVLLNLAPHMKDLHSYASMRLASVTLTCMKKFISLVKASNLSIDEQNDLTSIPGMYGEASRSLLQVVGQCLQPHVLAKNLHLLYALVYLQSDLQTVIESKLFAGEDELQDVSTMVEEARCIICENGNAQTAIQAMSSLDHNLRRLLRVYHGGGGGGSTSSSSASMSAGGGVSSGAGAGTAPSSPSSRTDSSLRSSDTSFMNDVKGGEDFSFTYEEEPDPEPFFIPYVWDVTICACTASFIEWDKPKVLVFPLQNISSTRYSTNDTTSYSKDVMDVV